MTCGRSSLPQSRYIGGELASNFTSGQLPG